MKHKQGQSSLYTEQLMLVKQATSDEEKMKGKLQIIQSILWITGCRFNEIQIRQNTKQRYNDVLLLTTITSHSTQCDC